MTGRTASAAAFSCAGMISPLGLNWLAQGPPVVLCTNPPLPESAALSATVYQPGISLRFPTRAHYFGLAAPSTNGSAGCYNVLTGITASPGPGLLGIAAGNASSQRAQVEYFESVAVAFGLRPYVSNQSSLFFREQYATRVMQRNYVLAQVHWGTQWNPTAATRS